MNIFAQSLYMLHKLGLRLLAEVSWAGFHPDESRESTSGCAADHLHDAKCVGMIAQTAQKCQHKDVRQRLHQVQRGV